jgi:glycosyltransferase involved in cell wall biosynthesis
MSDTVFQPTILIPSYNTGAALLRRTLDAVMACGWPVCVVIDGSTDGSEKALLGIEGDLQIITLPKNVGKGAAIHAAALQLHEKGISHVLVMDSDGQHPATSVSRFMTVAKKYPDAVILGRPIFSADAPALRVQGRKVSNSFAQLETLGWGIDDSLFGMRLYPLRALLDVFAETAWARRFDFEPEVAVRLAWKGIPIINLATPVRYLSEIEDGVSQFRYLRDNTLLAGMHIRLMAGFVMRLPYLLWRKSNPYEHVSDAQAD